MNDFFTHKLTLQTLGTEHNAAMSCSVHSRHRMFVPWQLNLQPAFEAKKMSVSR